MAHDESLAQHFLKRWVLFQRPEITELERTHLSFRLQRFTAHALLLPFCTFIVFVLRFVARYRIENLAEIRRQYRDIARERTPLIICANHLTFIDSIIILWALANNWWYFFHYRFFSCNLPAGDVFKKKWIYRAVAYLSKCVYIHRDGTQSHKNTILNFSRDWIAKGEVFTIFPEGQRSRTGKFNSQKMVFGVGKIISQLPECRVLCMYVRSPLQETYSSYPPRGSRFHVGMRLIRPRSLTQGRDAYSEITHQIANTIAGLEKSYFESI